MTADLEDRLRTQAQKIADEGYHRWSELCVEVADVLGSQADRIQALEAKCALLAASLGQSESLCADLEQDARRYRRIRLGLTDRYGDVYAMVFDPEGDDPAEGDRLDALVDAAIAAQARTKEEKQK